MLFAYHHNLHILEVTKYPDHKWYAKKKATNGFFLLHILGQNKAKAISAEVLELNLKNKLEETGKTR